jgi:hypothetical protein
MVGWGDGSVVACLPSKCEALVFIPALRTRPPKMYMVSLVVYKSRDIFIALLPKSFLMCGMSLWTQQSIEPWVVKTVKTVVIGTALNFRRRTQWSLLSKLNLCYIAEFPHCIDFVHLERSFGSYRSPHRDCVTITSAEWTQGFWECPSCSRTSLAFKVKCASVPPEFLHSLLTSEVMWGPQ